MKRLVALLMILGFVAAATADSSDAVDPWWDTSTRGSATLPELVADGWGIVGYSVSHGESSLSRDYVLQHPEKPGAWHCNFFSVLLRDTTNDIIASCTALRQP